MSDKVFALIFYYARQGYPRQLQTVCNEVLRKRANDPFLKFWRAYGLLLEGSTAEAMRDLNQLANAPEVELCAAAAMLQVHESAKVVDHDAVMELQNKLEVEEVSASEVSALNLASYYVLTTQKERARGLVERVLRSQADNSQALSLLGWTILLQQQDEQYSALVDETEIDEAYGHFEAALEADSSDLQAMLGRAQVMLVKRNLPGALDLLTEVTVRFSWFVPALTERVRLLVALNDWEQAHEAIGLLLTADPKNLMAIAWKALYALTRQCDMKSATKLLQDLSGNLVRYEPKSSELLFKFARPFGRLAGADLQLLSITSQMAERATQLKPQHAPYLVEAGYQKLFMEEFQPASERFSAALAVDELSLDASCGQLEVAILTGNLDEAATQLGFLEELFASQASINSTAEDMGREPAETPELLYLKGLLHWKKAHVKSSQDENAQERSAQYKNSQDGLTNLERSITLRVHGVAEVPTSLEMVSALWPGRITGIVRMLLASVGSEPRSATEPPSPLINKCMRALDLLAKKVPLMMEPQVLAARGLYLNGSLDAALRKAQEILRLAPEDFSMHLLICSIYLHQEKPDLAMAALEQAVSSNFAIRESPLYHIINAKVLMATDRLEEARKALELAMSLPGVRKPLSPDQRARMTRRVIEPQQHERATIFLLLAKCLSKLSKLPDAPEAKKYMSDAINEFKNTSEAVRVTVTDSELAIARGDVEGALKRLREVPEHSPHYTKARMAMADIYLKHRRDKYRYVRCYMELVGKSQDYNSYCMLGEAFMQIQEPEKAVNAFVSAMEYNTKDTELILRVACALVTTHDYSGSIDYYNKAIRIAPSDYNLQLELARLLVRLRQWTSAVDRLNKCLDRPVDSEADANSVQGLAIDVEAYLQLALVSKGNLDDEGYVEALQRALATQEQLLTKVRGELVDTLDAARNKAASICFDLAEHFKFHRKYEDAIEFYNEALRHCESHAKSMLALAKLHLAEGDMDRCQEQCVTLLKYDPDNDEAAIMLAELMFHKEHYDSSIYHFQQLLERCPNHFNAMAQLVGLMRRAGRLEQMPQHFAHSEAASPKSAMDPGFHFCKGLYHRYVNEPREALKEFNFARKDSRWGAQAIMHMVEIYLNPDNDAVWAEKETPDYEESVEAIETARSLLRQVRLQDTHSYRYRVLECYAIMAGKEKEEVEEALSRLLDMGNADPNNVPVLLAMATGFMLLKQTPKARNQLKRVQKIPYKPEEAEEFERSWLLLTDIHIQGGKFDLAQDLCQKCLKYNKSCAKAWEYMGAIMEREQSYKDAAEHYENAWRHENQQSAQVGYKLAFNYLKAKRFVEAIDVCHRVIKAFPEYPRIRKDILEKARQGLKP